MLAITGCDGDDETGLDTEPALGCDEAGDLRVYVPPRGTYLRMSAADVNLGAHDAEPVSLATLGLAAGDEVRLQRIGEFQFRSQHPDLVYYGLMVLFSSTSELLPHTERHRVPGALTIASEAGTSHDHVTRPSFGSNEPTDIPEDIVIDMAPNGDLQTPVDTPVTLQIPEGAQYLFLSPEDDYFWDNLDQDEDFHLCITAI